MGQSAPLIPLTVVGPGFAGMNTQTGSTILGPEWAAEAQNMVFDNSGRPAARKGWTNQTTTGVTGDYDIEQLFEYLKLDGTSIIISASNNALYSGVTTLSDITGAVTATANNWQFVNFYGSVYGLQADHDLIYYSGSGNFAAVTASTGTVPDGNCLLAAFGRLWGSTSNGQILKYSGLLDATYWSGTGAGEFNFAQVWAGGIDSIQAVAAFNNYLVVFGKRHIILLQDSSNSTLGMDPTLVSVTDVIVGVGCAARDSIQNVDGDDLVFLSSSGLQSLRRVIEAKGNPLRDISKNIRDVMMSQVAAVASNTIRSTYNPREGFYLLLIPGSSYIYCFDTRLTMQDGTWRVTRWNSFVPKSMLTLDDRITLYSGYAGKIYSYSNYLDATATYRFIYNSGWLTISDEVRDRLKILKRLAAILSVNGAADVIFKWGFDFNDLLNSITRSTTAGTSGGEWGIGEWGLAEFGGASGLSEFEVPGWGTGQFIKIGLEADIDNTEFAIQQLQLFTKVGRIS